MGIRQQQHIKIVGCMRWGRTKVRKREWKAHDLKERRKASERREGGTERGRGG